MEVRALSYSRRRRKRLPRYPELPELERMLNVSHNRVADFLHCYFCDTMRRTAFVKVSSEHSGEHGFWNARICPECAAKLGALFAAEAGEIARATVEGK